MRVAMTGASGFIGRHAARSPVSKKVDVTAQFHDRPVDVATARAVQGDPLSGEGLSALLSDAGALSHCASCVGSAGVLQTSVNVDGTEKSLLPEPRTSLSRTRHGAGHLVLEASLTDVLVRVIRRRWRRRSGSCSCVMPASLARSGAGRWRRRTATPVISSFSPT